MNNNKETPATRQNSLFSQKLARFFALFNEAISFLARIAWPIIDIVFRIWIAQQLLVSAILLTSSWNTAVFLASQEYPVPWLSPAWQAFLGIFAQYAGGISLLLGLFTRAGALAVFVFAVMTQIYYTPIDLNLFWIILMLGYILRGPGPLSLDHLFQQGLSRSPLPFAMTLRTFFDRTHEVLSDAFLLILRIWLMITLLLVAQQINALSTMGMVKYSAWLPLSSAWFIFGNLSIALALLFGLGLATRLSAVAAMIIISINYMEGAVAFYPYWLMVMAVLFVSGPGRVSLDHLILSFLRQRYPQLSGKPAFHLDRLPHVVIVGGGFGGIACAKALRNVPAKVTLIDRHNYHLFQPLLYQVATGSLSPGDIAISIRSLFLKQFNAEVLLGNVTQIDKDKKIVKTDDFQISYDYLVIATGATHSYFGKDQWAPFAPGLKTINDATTVRSSLLETFELAEITENDEERQQLLNFVIVGAGPTGVELAGAIAELARYGMEKDFRRFDPASANIILVQAAPRVLPTFSEKISAKAQNALEKMGVKVMINSMVEDIDDQGVIVNGERIFSKSVLWAAGVTASPAFQWLGAEADRAGRIIVEEDLSLPGHPDIFVIGDTASSNAWDGQPVPGLAPAAKQAGKYVAKKIATQVYNKTYTKPFKYKHLGSLATIGRKSAVAEFNTFKVSGELAWWFWGGVHVSFLLGGRNRLSVIVNWLWAYFTLRANNLLITKTSRQKHTSAHQAKNKPIEG
ncbi:DoxX family membrane protein [Legionella israelensis]|uniref:FAD-dependent oxidoreductase n=1 Tax=Legionella israelensis TaxID=454 RepID=UPI00117ED515|nr:FAD-dependent oxidoreductase [Legionella israelensis]QDP71091.1 DoxX family membrane protein [Legionella israelensis]